MVADGAQLGLHKLQIRPRAEGEGGDDDKNQQ
jgi:hypothetical protein